MGNVLQEVEDNKYLGVFIQNNLKWDKHSRYAASKASRMLNFIQRNFHSCSKTVKGNLYKTIVQPHLEYANAAWNPGTQKNKDSLQKVQRRAARFVSNDFSPSSSVTSMLNDLKWDNIENRRTTQRLATLHKILHEEIDIPHHNYIQSKPQRSRRTHNKQFNLTNCTSTPFAQSFFPETIKLWNSLPQSTVDVKLNTTNSKKSFQNINSSLLPLSPWLVKLPVIVPSGLFGRRLHKVQGTRYKVQG